MKSCIRVHTVVIAAALSLAASAPSPAQTGRLPVPRDSAAICGLVRNFFTATAGKPVTAEMAHAYGVDQFANTLTEMTGKPFWMANMHDYVQRDVRSIRKDDSLVIVKYRITADSLPYHGPLTIDWVFFLRRIGNGQWRIFALRRFAIVDKGISALLTLDQSKDYPASLKGVIAWETEPMVWDNDRLKENFREHRGDFATLAEQFSRPRDSLHWLGRVDRRISQVNRAVIDWGVAAQDVPQEAVDEFLQNASPEQRRDFEAEMRHVARLRKQGTDSLMKYVRKYRLSAKRLDSVVTLMRQARVSFITNKLPWKGSVQLTVTGAFDDALGYLYSPSGELPLISPEEYFDLEEIGDGWWVFRST